MTYGVRAAWEVTGIGGAVTGAGRVANGIDGAVPEAVGVGVMIVGKDEPLVVTAVLARPVLEPSP